MRPLSTVLALAALAGTAQAQTLDADVVRDPNAGLAVYTATVSGPPGGFYSIYGSLGILPPYTFGGVFGNIYLDPFQAIQLSTLSPLDLLGQGNLQFAVPLASFQDLTLGFQSVVIDPLSQLAVTNLGSAVQGSTPSGFGLLSWEANHRTDTNLYTMRLFGNPGAQVKVTVNGGDKADVSTNLDGAGQATIQFPVVLSSGDDFLIQEGGSPLHTWNHF